MTSVEKSCAGCKHHSKISRPTIKGVADGEMELIEEDDEVLELVFSCRHPDVQNGESCAVGLEAAVKLGSACAYFTAGQSKPLNEQLQRMLDASNSRHGCGE